MLDTPNIAVICLMLAVTFGLRAGGYWMMGRVALTTPVRRALEAIPGSILIATVLPTALRAGPVGWIVVAAAALTMWVTGKEFLALIVGFALVAGLRAAGL